MQSRLPTKLAVGAATIALGAAGAVAAGAAAPEDEPTRPAVAVEHTGDNLPDAAADRAREASAGSHDEETDEPTDTADDAVESDDVESDETTDDETDTETDVEDGVRADNHGLEVSTVARETEATGADKGAEVSSVARGDHGSDASGGAPETGSIDTPAPVDTPNRGGAAHDGDDSES